LDGATAAAATTPVADEEADDEPALFDAVTTTRTVEPTSADVSGYVCPVAPATSLQPFPLWLQRCHWYAYAIGAVPDQEPESAVSVCPSCAVPLIDGKVVFDGCVATAVTTPVAAEEADDEPALFDAVTATRTVEPTSPARMTYVVPVAPAMSEQVPPPASQRRH
jgi:hypothetical protein